MRALFGRMGPLVLSALWCWPCQLPLRRGPRSGCRSVIGNSTYRNVPALTNPTNNAQDVAASFERLGFSVRTITNATV